MRFIMGISGVGPSDNVNIPVNTDQTKEIEERLEALNQKLESLNQKFNNEIKKIFEDPSLTNDEKLEKIDDLRNQTGKEFAQLFEEFDQLMEMAKQTPNPRDVLDKIMLPYDTSTKTFQASIKFLESEIHYLKYGHRLYPGNPDIFPHNIPRNPKPFGMK
jgi:adenylosuccinate synthase